MGVSERTGPSDLLVTVLTRKVRAIVIASDWMRKRFVGKEMF